MRLSNRPKFTLGIFWRWKATQFRNQLRLVWFEEVSTASRTIWQTLSSQKSGTDNKKRFILSKNIAFFYLSSQLSHHIQILWLQLQSLCKIIFYKCQSADILKAKPCQSPQLIASNWNMTFCRIFQFSVYGSDQLNNEDKIGKQIGEISKTVVS